MVDFEKGSPGWDTGIILTRHTTIGVVCARVADLRSTTPIMGSTLTPHERLVQALSIECTCGAGDSESEQTSIEPTKRWVRTLMKGAAIEPASDIASDGSEEGASE